jgi:hypothetical protein
MDGSKIGSVNTAIEEVIPAIKEVSELKIQMPR